MRPSNFKFDMVDEDHAILAGAIAILMQGAANGWRSDGKKLVICSSVENGDTAFPCALTSEIVTDIAIDWLGSVVYPSSEFYDGHVTKGWRVTASDTDWNVLFTVEPWWAEHHK